MAGAKQAAFGEVMRGLAMLHPDKVALVDDHGSVTFAGVNGRMNRFCHALAGYGLRSGDRIAVLSRNRIEVLECYGASKAGVIVVPLNWRLSQQELLHPLLDSRPAVILADPDFTSLIDGLRPHLPFVRHFVGFGAAADGWSAYEDVLAGAPAHEPESPVGENDVLSIMYTSGTTGKPKGAMLTHGGLMRNGHAAADLMLQLKEADIALAAMPLFHVGGLWYYLFPALSRGCTCVLLPEFSADRVLAAMQAHAVTCVHLVPTMINAVVSHPDIGRADLSSLRIMYYAASSIPVDMLRRAMQTFPDCDFIQSYGSTEAGTITLLSAADHRAALQSAGKEHRLATVGRPLHCEVRILDADRNGIGEIAVRSNRSMAGYWQNPQASEAARTEGFLRTGDLGSIDAEGYLTIADRKNDLIVSGGENVYPREVEDALYQEPAILEAAVFGLPDPHWVEKVAAAVVLRPGTAISADELKRRLRTRLASYKCPKDIHFLEALPKSGAGKILKKDLRNLYK